MPHPTEVYDKVHSTESGVYGSYGSMRHAIADGNIKLAIQHFVDMGTELVGGQRDIQDEILNS